MPYETRRPGTKPERSREGKVHGSSTAKSFPSVRAPSCPATPASPHLTPRRDATPFLARRRAAHPACTSWLVKGPPTGSEVQFPGMQCRMQLSTTNPRESLDEPFKQNCLGTPNLKIFKRAYVSYQSIPHHFKYCYLSVPEGFGSLHKPD